MEITPRSAADLDLFFPDPHAAAAEAAGAQAWAFEQICAIVVQTAFRGFAGGMHGRRKPLCPTGTPIAPLANWF